MSSASIISINEESIPLVQVTPEPLRRSRSRASVADEEENLWARFWKKFVRNALWNLLLTAITFAALYLVKSQSDSSNMLMERIGFYVTVPCYAVLSLGAIAALIFTRRELHAALILVLGVLRAVEMFYAAIAVTPTSSMNENDASISETSMSYNQKVAFVLGSAANAVQVAICYFVVKRYLRDVNNSSVRLHSPVQYWGRLCIGVVVSCAIYECFSPIFSDEYKSSLANEIITDYVSWFSKVATIAIVGFSHYEVTLHDNHNEIMVGNTHSHGLVLVFLLGGVLLRTVLRVIEIVFDVYLDKEWIGFMVMAREAFTTIIPMYLHLWNIWFYHRLPPAARINTGRRAKRIITTWLLLIHAVAIGYVMQSSREIPLTLMISRVAAFLAFIDLDFLLISITSPLVRIAHQVFAIRESIHKIRLHRSLSYVILMYSLIHSLCHIIQWAKSPQFSVNGISLYGFDKPPVYTGALMIVFMGLLAVSGHAHASGGRWFFIHVILAVGLWSCFSLHGYMKALGPRIGDWAMLGGGAVCVVTYVLHFVLHPPLKVEVMNEEPEGTQLAYKRTTSEGTYLFLKAAVRSSVPPQVAPGSYFFILRPGMQAALGHPFTAIEARGKFIWFLIQISNQADASYFTTQLFTGIADYRNRRTPDHPYRMLNLHGPFDGPVPLFITALNAKLGRGEAVDVYLCSRNSAVSTTYGILMYLVELSNPTVHVRFVWGMNNSQVKDMLQEKLDAVTYTSYNQVTPAQRTQVTIDFRENGDVCRKLNAPINRMPFQMLFYGGRDDTPPPHFENFLKENVYTETIFVTRKKTA